ncbi:MAG: hypothetical protein ACFFAS_18825 [Promethearchaeota archaeon]
MSREEMLVIDRACWENMRLLKLKAAIMQRYLELEALADEDFEL